MHAISDAEVLPREARSGSGEVEPPDGVGPQVSAEEQDATEVEHAAVVVEAAHCSAPAVAVLVEEQGATGAVAAHAATEVQAFAALGVEPVAEVLF